MLHMDRLRDFSADAPGRRSKAGRKGGGRRRQPDPPRCAKRAFETAEAYWLGRLDPEKAKQFTGHCEVCHACAAESQRALEFIRAIRAALARNPPSLIYRCPPVIFGGPRT